MEKSKEYFMSLAIKEAKKAEAIDEVPIGCVIVKDNRVISRAFNKRETLNDVTAHAEILAIKNANKKLNSWRLNDCDIYITLEPCIMCSGAIIQSRIKNIYFGAYDLKGGGLVSSIDLTQAKNINHHPNIEGGIMADECSSIITSYFKNKRTKV